MSLFSPPKRQSVSLWCGEKSFLLLADDHCTATRTARIVTYVDDVHLWINDVHYGKFSRHQLGSWLRLRTGNSPESAHALLTMGGGYVEINVKSGIDRGQFIGAIPGDLIDWLTLYL